jgi:hypothetical protein
MAAMQMPNWSETYGRLRSYSIGAFGRQMSEPLLSLSDDDRPDPARIEPLIDGV